MSGEEGVWTIEWIAEGLGAPEVRRCFLDEIWRAPVDELPEVVGKWQRVAAGLVSAAGRGRDLLAQAGPDGELPGEWHRVTFGEPRAMTADELQRIADRAGSAERLPTREDIDDALWAARAYPEDRRDPRPGDR